MKLEFTRQAQKDYDTLERNIKKRIVDILEKMITQSLHSLQAKKLRPPYSEYYRIRVGDYRIVFKWENLVN
ncbi:MAG: type II toxin-antitoxin system RelE/ParE family toxin [Dethiobacter sp.]|jgi:addiction module RelE/StbE family toxin|nr:type II toxin-antitoxin system RelE/ParE family toxin [Dethiobacter sp.]